MDDVSELVAKLDMLGENAHERATGFHKAYQEHELLAEPRLAAAALNDHFYWAGKATAYKGIAAGLVLMDMVARDMVARDEDEVPTCP